MIRNLLLFGVGLCLAVACGGSIANDNDKHDGSAGFGGSGASSTGGLPHVGGAGGTGAHAGTGGTGGKGGTSSGGNAGTGGYIDPGCPDAAPPPPSYECDPFGPNTCDPGDACFPYVVYPTGPCDVETYGTACSPAGSGVQGTPCGSQGSFVVLCSAGYDCFITGQGTECLKLCKLDGPDECPPGLLCGGTDVEGFGACD